jgi:hypothetical protein
LALSLLYRGGKEDDMGNLNEQTIGCAVRCSNCANRVGIDSARETEDKLVFCPRCFSRRSVLKTPQGAAIEIVG